MKNSSSSAVTNGKIFSQHILIREIVLKNFDLPAAIEKVVTSHHKSLASKAQVKEKKIALSLFLNNLNHTIPIVTQK